MNEYTPSKAALAINDFYRDYTLLGWKTKRTIPRTQSFCVFFWQNMWATFFMIPVRVILYSAVLAGILNAFISVVLGIMSLKLWADESIIMPFSILAILDTSEGIWRGFLAIWGLVSAIVTLVGWVILSLITSFIAVIPILAVGAGVVRLVLRFLPKDFGIFKDKVPSNLVITKITSVKHKMCPTVKYHDED